MPRGPLFEPLEDRVLLDATSTFYVTVPSQQSRVAGDLRAMEFELQTAVEIDPKTPPLPVQKNRIASVIRAAEYIDWSAPVGIDGGYCVTTVDRQGNESKPVVVEP